MRNAGEARIDDSVGPSIVQLLKPPDDRPDGFASVKDEEVRNVLEQDPSRKVPLGKPKDVVDETGARARYAFCRACGR